MIWYGVVWYSMVCMYVCMYVCIYVYMYVCMYVCICMYVCMYVMPQLAKKYHPDIHKDDKNAAKSFTEVNNAYQVSREARNRVIPYHSTPYHTIPHHTIPYLIRYYGMHMLTLFVNDSCVCLHLCVCMRVFFRSYRNRILERSTTSE